MLVPIYGGDVEEWMSDVRMDIERKGGLDSLLVNKILNHNNNFIVLSCALYFDLNVRRSFDFSGSNTYCYRISAYCFSHVQGRMLSRLHKSSSMIMHVSNFSLFLFLFFS